MPADQRQWHHVVITTYGAWLHGDSRGFRTRHHRQHIEGDYKHPPPAGTYSVQERRSRKSLKQRAVVLPSEYRSRVGHAMHRAWTRCGAWVLITSVGGQHVHVLVKLPRGKDREIVGRVKQEATRSLRAQGWRGRVWAVRCKALPICNRRHHVNTYHYIAAHESEGAWIGVWREAPTGVVEIEDTRLSARRRESKPREGRLEKKRPR